MFGLKSSAWLAGGLYGASLGGSIWTATHKPSTPSATYDFDRLMNQISSNDRIPIIYGTRKFGGYQTYHKTASDKQSLVKDVVFCEGQVSKITDVRANDLVVSSLPGCSYNFYNGSPTQSPPENYLSVGGYRNCAWLRANLKVSDKLQGGNPTITAIVHTYSSNPALCVKDYLLNKRYGAGHFISTDMIDEDSFAEVADYCDELVTTRVPTTLATYDAVQNKITELQGYINSHPNLSQKTRDNINDEIISLQESLITIQNQPVKYTLEVTPRYSLNIIITENKSHIEILQDMLAVFGGFLVFTNNKVALKCEKATPVSYAFNDDNIIKDSISYTQYPIEQSPNRYNITFYDPNNQWTGVKLVVEDTVDQKERGKIVSKDVNLIGCTSQSQALRLGRLYRDKVKLCSIVAQWQTGTMAMHLEPGDVVTLSKKIFPNGQEQWLFQDMPFRILEISEDKGVYTIKAEQYNESIYNDELGAQIQVKNYVEITNPFSDIIPDVSNIKTEQNYYVQKDGTIVSDIKLSWDSLNYQYLNQYIVLYSINNGNTWISAGNTTDNTFTVHNTLVGKYYLFKVIVENIKQRKSTGISTDLIFIIGKDSPPSDVTGLTVAQKGDYLVINGNHPKDVDFNYIEIRVDGDSWYNSKLVAKINNFPALAPNSDILNGTHVFRAKAIDNGGNYSLNDVTYIANITGINKYKNIVLDRNDIDTMSGTLVNLVRLPNKQLMPPHSIGLGDYDSFIDLPIENFCLPNTHVEFISAVIDTFKIGKTNINFIFDSEVFDQYAVFGSYPDRLLGDYPFDTFGHITSKSTTEIFIKLSNDNISWSDWQPYISAEYDFRYLQYKYVLNFESYTARVIVKSLQQFYDVPDAIFSKTIEIPVGGKDIIFTDYDVDFYYAPTEVMPTVINGMGNVFPDIKNLSADGLHIDCYDRTGTKVAGTVLLVCKGY